MKYVLLIIFFQSLMLQSQTIVENQLTYNEFLGFVKKFHPQVKQANLTLSKAQAELLAVRGAFDPKLESTYSQKQYADKNYYTLFNSGFKIPTWYGVELKAAFDNHEGIYLNPENVLPNQGLTSFGISVPLGQGLWINQRMADLKKAKLQVNLSTSEKMLQAVEVIYEASLAYFDWKKNFEEYQLYQEYVSNAQIRFNGIKISIAAGDKPAIDSTEAGIVLKTRQLNAEESWLKFQKSRLQLSNFLWLENNVPLELEAAVQPEEISELQLSELLKTSVVLTNEPDIKDHPKINMLENKVGILEVERKLKANQLLPKIDVGYYYLSEPSYIQNYRFEDYKVGVNFSYPLFLRKERGQLKLARFKVEEMNYQLDLEKLQLKNKIKAQQTEIQSVGKQKNMILSLVGNHQKMLQSEERLFSVGESSVFLVNTRENNLVSAKLAAIHAENKLALSHVQLFKVMGVVE